MRAPRPPNQVRIIAGAYRRRRILFPRLPALRPTPDRVRETLFNWLRREIAGARCLDLFAGSGALGFEALSRGAADVVFVESNRRAAEAIRGNISRLEIRGAEVFPSDARDFLAAAPAAPFDIVFLDPPYGGGTSGICRRLDAGGLVGPGGRIFIESAAPPGERDLPADWSPLARRRAGRVHYALYAKGGRDGA